MAIANLKQPDPKEADADRSHPNHRAEEEEKDQYQEDDVVDRENLRGLDEDPVYGVDDVGVAENVTTVGLAD